MRFLFGSKARSKAIAKRNQKEVLKPVNETAPVAKIDRDAPAPRREYFTPAERHDAYMAGNLGPWYDCNGPEHSFEPDPSLLP